VILWIWTALLSGVVLFPTYTKRGNAFVPLAVAGMALVLYTVLHPQVRRNRSEPGDRVQGSIDGRRSRDQSATDSDLDEETSR
jgi:hypothetical protein